MNEVIPEINKIPIREIQFPNTVADSERGIFRSGNGTSIVRIQKNGEMAHVDWFRIIKFGDIVAEIKESVCDVYYKVKEDK